MKTLQNLFASPQAKALLVVIGVSIIIAILHFSGLTHPEKF
jgi:hypothetical protein